MYRFPGVLQQSNAAFLTIHRIYAIYENRGDYLPPNRGKTGDPGILFEGD